MQLCDLFPTLSIKCRIGRYARLETLVTRPDASNRLSHVTWVFRITLRSSVSKHLRFGISTPCRNVSFASAIPTLYRSLGFWPWTVTLCFLWMFCCLPWPLPVSGLRVCLALGYYCLLVFGPCLFWQRTVLNKACIWIYHRCHVESPLQRSLFIFEHKLRYF